MTIRSATSPILSTICFALLIALVCLAPHSAFATDADENVPVEGADDTAFPATEVLRLSGDSALDTMQAIVHEGHSSQLFAEGSTVVLASVDGYWDALTAAGVAGLEKAPVVMTSGSELSTQALGMLTQLKPKKIVVCGGPATVSDAVAQAAQSSCGASELVPMSGRDASGTAIDVYES